MVQLVGRQTGDLARCAQRERGMMLVIERKEYHDKKAVDRQLSEGDLVLV